MEEQCYTWQFTKILFLQRSSSMYHFNMTGNHQR